MAITQQLARLPADLVARCVQDVAVLDEVCSFRAVSRSDCLDLDWYPRDLECAGVPSEAFEAQEEVNPAYRDWPDSIFEHPVTAHGPDAVRRIAADLDALTLLQGVSELDLAETFACLRAFYRGAAEHGLAVVLWWN